ncbi:cytochrome P450 [Colletotrichum truncatum]|uniref:Cytochrome P450 n=1 Tax=Colletotrichum truncatum TaxID=5467 RepID=A0ACC3Z331_COLTU|nr:cytochrome P450 [Colletotrichum truncatum]KAF6793191.1 cytochrome P450 [Colletotrichum truncatum]
MAVRLCARASLILAAVAWRVGRIGVLAAAQIFFISFTAQCLVVLCYWAFIYPHYISPMRHLPTPEGGHFLIGQMLNQILTPGPADMFLSWMRRWPEAPFVRYLSIGNSETLMVNSLAALKEVQQTKAYSFRKSQLACRMFSPITGHGLMFSEGDERKRQRTQLAKAFSNQNTRKMLPVFQLKARQLCEAISQDLGGEDRKVIEVERFIKKATLDAFVIGSIGCDLESISLPEAHFYDVYERIIRQPALGHLITFIDGHIPLRSWLPLKSNKKWLRDLALIRTMLLNCVGNRLMETKKDKERLRGLKSERRDILTFILEECQFDEKEREWTDLELLEYMLNFIAGGHETTGSTIMWITYVLATMPSVQERLKREISELAARKPPGWEPTYEEIEHLSYVNGFLREVLRYYSPAIFLPRETVEDVTVCGIFIPKGTQITLCPAVAHFNPLVWGPDAEVFDPDRWSDGRAAKDSYAMEAFLQGSSGCIARNMALLNVKTVIVELVRSFKFSPQPGYDGVLKLSNPNFTLRPKYTLRIVAEREMNTELSVGLGY